MILYHESILFQLYENIYPQRKEKDENASEFTYLYTFKTNIDKSKYQENIKKTNIQN